ncbi:hypothetical protein ACPV5U_08485 [Vibrio mediterranei]
MVFWLIGLFVLFFIWEAKFRQNRLNEQNDRIGKIKSLVNEGIDADLLLKDEKDIVVQVAIESHVERLKLLEQGKNELKILKCLYMDSLDIDGLKSIRSNLGHTSEDIEKYMVICSIIDGVCDAKIDLHNRYNHKCSDKAIVAMVINRLIDQANDLVQQIVTDADFSPVK